MNSLLLKHRISVIGESGNPMVYQTKNACSKRPSILCLITIILYLGLIVLHIFYILLPIVQGYVSSNPIIYVLVALHFVLLCAVVYDYLWIAIHDPVDRVVYDPQLAQGIDKNRLDFCSFCDAKRLIGSHHCRKCGRCTEEFDHHCEYLNNCIGNKNYQKFLRLLAINCVFHINLIGQSIWVFLRAHFDMKVRQAVPNSYWVLVGIMSLSFILLVTIFILMFFHCYISCCLHQTTLGYLFGTQDNKNKSKSKRAPVETERQFQ